MGEKLGSKTLIDATVEFMISSMKEIEAQGTDHLTTNNLWDILLNLDQKGATLKERNTKFGGGMIIWKLQVYDGAYMIYKQIRWI